MMTCSRFGIPYSGGSVIDGFSRSLILREIQKHSEQCWANLKGKAASSEPVNFVRHDVFLSAEFVEFLRPQLENKMTADQISALVGRTAKTVSATTVENKIHLELEF